MATTVGLTLAAAGIAAANEAIFAPIATHQPLWQNFNWKLIPAAGIAAIMFTGFDTLAPGWGKGLAGLTLLMVLLVPSGNTSSPIDNASSLLNMGK